MFFLNMFLKPKHLWSGNSLCFCFLLHLTFFSCWDHTVGSTSSQQSPVQTHAASKKKLSKNRQT